MEAITSKEIFPLVSIVIPSYNRATMIGEAVESAMSQDYPNLEIIITDNCSTDDTDKVLQQFLSDPRIRYYKNEVNIGMLPNFKRGIEVLAQGKYFVNLCSDDALCYSGFISEAMRLLSRHENIIIVRGKSYLEDLSTGKRTEGFNGNLFNREFREGSDVFINYTGKESLGWEGVLIERERLNSLRIFEESYTGFDLSANLRLLLMGNAGFINKHCYVYKVHLGQASQEFTAEHSIANLQCIERPYQFAKNLNIFDRKTLDSWRYVLLSKRAIETGKHFYRHNRSEYYSFISKLEEQYSLKFDSLNKDLKTKIIFILYYFPGLGRVVTALKQKLF